MKTASITHERIEIMKAHSKRWSRQGLVAVVLIGLVLLGTALFRSCKASREQDALTSNTLYEIRMQLAAVDALQSCFQLR